jgi:hypothetical protein
MTHVIYCAILCFYSRCLADSYRLDLTLNSSAFNIVHLMYYDQSFV